MWLIYISTSKKKRKYKNNMNVRILFLKLCVRLTNTNIMVNKYFSLKTKGKNIKILTNVYVLLCRCMQETKILKISCAAICVRWLCILREVLIHMRIVMCFWGCCVLPRWSFVSIGVTKCLRLCACVRLEHVQPEGRNERKKEGETSKS